MDVDYANARVSPRKAIKLGTIAYYGARCSAL